MTIQLMIKNVVSRLSLLFHTMRYMQPIQLYGRVLFRLKSPVINCSPAPIRREMVRDWQKGPLRKPMMLDSCLFRYLNQVHPVEQRSDWNNPAYPKLWLYNLHYFDDLNALDASQRRAWHRQLIKRWISENPVGEGSAWEPYPLSLRIVNWIKWIIDGEEPSATLLDSLACQVRYLTQRLEFHLLGNHLLVNAKALVFAGLFFGGRESANWLIQGEQILEREIREQILADGGHFERSPMYHLLILEDLLDLFNLYNLFEKPYPPYWRDVIEKMLSWSAVMRHPDGEIPLFNDAAMGVAPMPNQLDDYALKLGFQVSESEQSRFFQPSGFVSLQSQSARVLADIGTVGPDYLPAHAHAETFSFEFSLGEQRVFVNSGTSLYELGPEREFQRSTEAHNTVEVDGENSSEVWASFRVARRARVSEQKFVINSGSSFVSATHDGYARLKPPVLHQRSWWLNSGSLQITDHLRGNSEHTLQIIFILHPDVRVAKSEEGFHLTVDETDIKILFQPDSRLDSLSVETKYYPEFGISMSTQVIKSTQRFMLPVDLCHQIKWIERR